ncbi:MAG: phosphatidate cytidylyltransferase [Clostridia bacterium]|nr:phosphatidate cytidylyltransferase [Clostridia bacterium]MDD4145557.1 phosphatidate cytidylyltransferase [Clostridia bacterium]MDD4664967.1 phosphatidate cytidylyltransferase [Clostridia bacterium]
MLFQRIISALIGIPLLIFIIFKGDPYLVLAVFLLTLLAFLEFRNIIKNTPCQALVILLWVGALLFPLIFLLKYNYILPLFVFYLLFCLGYYVVYYPRYSPLDLSFTLLGIIYIFTGFFHILLLRQLADGFWLVLYVFIVVWGTDTGAYVTGMMLGKHQLAPLLSPKKTREGLLGGLISGVLAAYIYSICIPLAVGKILFYMAPFVSLAGQLGDLFESSLKRFAKIKDSGRIIPGHGGILDRFDSALWAAPVTYYLLIILERLM